MILSKKKMVLLFQYVLRILDLVKFSQFFLLLKWGHENSGASYEISSKNSFLADADNDFRSGRILTFHSTQIIKDLFLNALLRWLGCGNKAVVPRFNTNFIKHSIAYRGSVIWNALSQRLNVKTSNFKNGPVTRWWKHIKK